MSIIHTYHFSESQWSDAEWNAYTPLASNTSLKNSVKDFVENQVPGFIASTVNTEGGVTNLSQLRGVGVNKKIKIIVSVTH